MRNSVQSIIILQFGKSPKEFGILHFNSLWMVQNPCTPGKIFHETGVGR